jgi:membrane protease YdiL (CAAX protease family)
VSEVVAPAPLPAHPERPEGADPFPRWPLSYGGYGFAIGVCGGIAALLVMLPPFSIVSLWGWGFKVPTDDTLPVLELVATFVQDILWVVGAILLAKRIAPPKPWHFGLRRPRFGQALGFMALAIAAYIAISLLYNVILKPPDEQPINTGDLLGIQIASCFLIIVSAPICEEFFFRGFLYRILRGRLGLWPALVLDGAIFGAIHLTSGGPLAVALIAPLGFLLCLIYERSGSIFPTIALHALNNSVVSASEFDRASGVALGMGGAMLLACLLGALLTTRSSPPVGV